MKPTDSVSPLQRDAVWMRYVLHAAWETSRLSNCRDRQLAAFLVKDGYIIGRGWNLCAPPPYNYGDQLPFCLRENASRGTRRKACRGFHAEIFACLDARRGRGVSEKEWRRFAWHQFDGEKKGARTKRVLQRRFSEEDRGRLRGSVLYLVGVAYVCEACQWLLDWLGIRVYRENIVRDRILPDEVARLIESKAQES